MENSNLLRPALRDHLGILNVILMMLREENSSGKVSEASIRAAAEFLEQEIDSMSDFVEIPEVTAKH